MMSLQELEQDPFDADEFVERLAWRAAGGGVRQKGDDMDPMQLHDAFEKTIKDLKDLNTKIQRKVEKLEVECKEEEKDHWGRVSNLQKHNKTASENFQGLDERINFVATKVVHLGDQLEGVNTPRTRAAEAQLLMKYYKEFMDFDMPQSPVFTDPFQVQLAADVIQKLYILANELPIGDKFDVAKDRISAKYNEIENSLIQDFRAAYLEGNKRDMKRLAAILANFKGYNQCIDIFIEESQKGAFLRPDIFTDIPPLCERTSVLIQEVFSNPDSVMSKFVLNIYRGKLQEHMASRLADQSDLEKYLNSLHTLYVKTTGLTTKLSIFKLGTDAQFLTKVTKSIFQKYMEKYIMTETKFLRDRCSMVLHRYYATKGHQKKNLASGGLNELRRDLQNVLGAKANLNIGPTIENYQGETFLSQEVAINVMQEAKLAFKRCQMMSSTRDLAPNAAMIFEILVQYLCVEHIEYAVIIGLQAVPLADPKSEPEIYFFDVVGQANTIFHLFEKQFSDHLMPLVSGTPKHSECIMKKRDIVESIENKLDLGLDRTLSCVVGWVRHILKTEQKPTDFKPEGDDMQMYSQACEKVVKYMGRVLEKVHFGLDGKNVDAVLMELGIRLHRVIYEHLMQYQYNSIGAMLAICDVNEYRKCVKEFNVEVVTQLFDTLHSLCNMLVVVPENLKKICSGDQLGMLDKTVLQSFVQLRADYKTARLAHFLK